MSRLKTALLIPITNSENALIRSLRRRDEHLDLSATSEYADDRILDPDVGDSPPIPFSSRGRETRIDRERLID